MEFRLSGLAAWRGFVRLVNGNDLTHAAAISFYALLSLFPFLLLIISMLGSITADDEDRLAVLEFVFRYFPTRLDFVTTQLDAFRQTRLQVGVAGGLALIWASLGVFGAITSAVNQAWGVEKQRSFFKHRLISFLMLLAGGGVMLVALLLVSAVEVAEASWFGEMLGRFQWLSALQSLTVAYSATILLVLAMGLLFYFIPQRDDAVSRCLGWRGAHGCALAPRLRRFLVVHRRQRTADAGTWVDSGGRRILAVDLRLLGHPYVRRGIYRCVRAPAPPAP